MHPDLSEYIATQSSRSRKTAKWLKSGPGSEMMADLDDLLTNDEKVYFIDSALVVLPGMYNGGGMLLITDRKFVFCGTTNVALRLNEIIEYSGRAGEKWVGPDNRRDTGYLNIRTSGGTKHCFYWEKNTATASAAERALRKAKLAM
jgi:hypothetical protein